MLPGRIPLGWDPAKPPQYQIEQMENRMPMQKYKFGFIANSIEVADMFSACIDPYSEEVTVRYTTMEEAIPVATELLESGIEVLLCSDGTGSLLLQTLGQPIVNITRTHLDVLKSLMKAKKYGPFIGLTNYGAPIGGIELFDALLSVKTRQVVFTNKTELINGITEAVQAGIDCLVGAGVSQHIVSGLGGSFVRVPLRRDMIIQALKEARAMASARRKEKKDQEEMRIILQIIKEGMLVIDNFDNVKICNQAAADILGVGLQEVIGKPVSEFLQDSDLLGILRNGKAELDQICRVGGEYLVTNSLPIVIDGKAQGVVSTFKEAARIHNIDRKLKEKLYLDGFVATYTVHQIDSRSPQMKKVIEKAKKYAETDLSILLQGETGTGKEILGHTVHNLSSRRDKPFVAINCSALTESLLESELFGYEEGAFTGAKKGGKIGLFELANQGSIFLDEIADMSPNIQVKLLRVIEEKKVRRIGGDRLIPVDVRIISSTWKDLREEMEQGGFRMDLFFRVANLKVRIPPLRERVEDIPCLVRKLLKKYGKDKRAISPDMYAAMESYHWPGNVRELNSLVESYLILLGDRDRDEALFRDLFEDLGIQGRNKERPAEDEPADQPPPSPVKSLHEQAEDFERSIINETLSRFQFNRKATARHLGISMNTLWRKMNPA